MEINNYISNIIVNVYQVHQIYSACVACLGTFMSGVDMTFSADFNGNIRDMTMTLYQESLIGSINFYARAFSSVMIAYFINIIGRKNSLILVLTFNVISWILMYFFSYSMEVIYASRVFSGLAAGMRTSTTMYIAEIAHKSRRGFLLSFLGLSVSLGISMTYAIQYFYSWETVSLVSLIISGVGFVQVCFLEETKYWYLYGNNEEKARNSIKWFDKSLTENDVQAEIDEIRSTTGQVKEQKSSMLKLLANPSNGKCFIFAFFMFAFFVGCGRNQISAYPNNYYTPFQLPIEYKTVSLLSSVLVLVMSFSNVFLMDKVPRKKMLHWCCWLMIVCLVPPSFHDFLIQYYGRVGGWIVAGFLIVYYSISCGFLLCVISTIITEITSSSMEARGFIQSFTYFLSNLISGIYTEMFPYSLEMIRVNYVLIFFAINLVLLSFTVSFLSETRGKALHQCGTTKEKKVPV